MSTFWQTGGRDKRGLFLSSESEETRVNAANDMSDNSSRADALGCICCRLLLYVLLRLEIGTASSSPRPCLEGRSHLSLWRSELSCLATSVFS